MAVLPIAATLTPATGAPITFHGWSGWIDGVSVSVDRDMRPGQAGSVAQGIGRRAADSRCTAYRFFFTLALATAYCDIVENGNSPTPYKFVDAYGRSMNLRFVDATCNVTRCKGPVDGTTQTTYKVEVNITLERLP